MQFGVNVFGISADKEPMAIARESIERLSEFLFDTLQLKRTFTEVGIAAEDFPVMARRACGGGILPGFKPLGQKDIDKIFEMCL